MWTIPRCVLVLETFLDGRSTGRYGFIKRIVTVGRSPDSDLRLDHPGISRSHFRIERTERGYVLEDCRSANGVYVNAQRASSQLLHAGDELQVGKYSIQVSLRAECEYDGAGPFLEPEEEALRAYGLPTVRAPHLRADASPKYPES
jgi:pSer/pThr/pTyr-binding forkhead associated (FHA) protein